MRRLLPLPELPGPGISARGVPRAVPRAADADVNASTVELYPGIHMASVTVKSVERLRLCLRGCSVDVVLLTEFHLKDGDIVLPRWDGEGGEIKITFDRRRVVRWRNTRSSATGRCLGGANSDWEGLDVVQIPQEFLPARRVRCRPIVVSAIGGVSSPLRPIGVYMPPSSTAHVTPEQLRSLSEVPRWGRRVGGCELKD